MRLLKNLPLILAAASALAALAAGWLLLGPAGLLIAALCACLAPAVVLALRGRRAERDLERSETGFHQAQIENRQAEVRLKAAEDYFRQSQKMEAVGRLAGGIAHDFNNLLTAINGYAELLLSRLPAGDPNRPMVEEVRMAGEKATSITRQLLTFSRKQLISPVIMDLNALVQDLERMLQRLLSGEVEIAVDLAADLDPIKADPGQVGQVLLNLALNAKDAMPDGGRLAISTANVSLTGEETGYYLRPAPGDYVCLKVEDTGIGMDAEVREHLFEPFFTTKAGARSAGMGLPAVYGIADQGRGGIRLVTEEGSGPGGRTGTAFLIYFPAARSDWAPRSAREAAPAAGSKTPREETVLVVEDEENVRHLVGSVLRAQGYEVLEASGAREALHIHESHPGPIHVLLTDVIMPGKSGREVARELQGLRPGIRTIFMSGYTDDLLLQQGLEMSRALFLGKPFTPADLLRKLAESRELASAPEVGHP